MRCIFVILFIIGTTHIAWAHDLESPPPLREEPAAEQLYFQSIYDNFQKLEKITDNPNGNRKGKLGSTLMYKGVSDLGDTYVFFMINIDGEYHWWAIQALDWNTFIDALN